MEVETHASLQREGEIEDDIFYAELTRQILLLTAEDEDDVDRGDFPESSGSNHRRVAKMGNGTGPSCPAVLLPGSYVCWSGNMSRHGNGTGVFIPRIAAVTKSRRRHKPGKCFLRNDSIIYMLTSFHYLIQFRPWFSGRNGDRSLTYKPVTNRT
ncbi:hypothetical protein NMG60_11009532 [Bertholletia excelsa]